SWAVDPTPTATDLRGCQAIVVPNATVHPPGPLQRLHVARNQNAAPAEFSDWFADPDPPTAACLDQRGIPARMCCSPILQLIGRADPALSLHYTRQPPRRS